MTNGDRLMLKDAVIEISANVTVLYDLTLSQVVTGGKIPQCVRAKRYVISQLRTRGFGLRPISEVLGMSVPAVRHHVKRIEKAHAVPGGVQ